MTAPSKRGTTIGGTNRETTACTASICQAGAPSLSGADAVNDSAYEKWLSADELAIRKRVGIADGVHTPQARGKRHTKRLAELLRPLTHTGLARGAPPDRVRRKALEVHSPRTDVSCVVNRRGGCC